MVDLKNNSTEKTDVDNLTALISMPKGKKCQIAIPAKIKKFLEKSNVNPGDLIYVTFTLPKKIHVT
ncbi:MAG: hypothetical protein WC623_22565 [Pedobacter sp.]|uniref:hypothetical protein n=1 Tax=Pedobacter sp. TaxID=1411316 RepID=UPI003565EE3E